MRSNTAPSSPACFLAASRGCSGAGATAAAPAAAGSCALCFTTDGAKERRMADFAYPDAKQARSCAENEQPVPAGRYSVFTKLELFNGADLF